MFLFSGRNCPSRGQAQDGKRKPWEREKCSDGHCIESGQPRWCAWDNSQRGEVSMSQILQGKKIKSKTMRHRPKCKNLFYLLRHISKNYLLVEFIAFSSLKWKIALFYQFVQESLADYFQILLCLWLLNYIMNYHRKIQSMS